MTGYDALEGNAAWIDLTGRGEIVATGEDRFRLLHAISTNHIQQLGEGQGCYTFFLNAQGRIQADANVLTLGDSVLLDTEPELGERLLAHLDHYIIADDVTLEDRTGLTAVLAIEGPGAAAALATAGVPVPAEPYSHSPWGRSIVSPISLTGAPGYRIFSPLEAKLETVAALEAAGIPSADSDAARVVRLEHFKPRFGDDLFDTSLVHDTQQLHAVSFNKGCYLGQEIVERVRSRGMVHRLLAGLRIAGANPPGAGTPVLAGGVEAGKITSAAYSPALGSVVALAYLKRDSATPGSTVECAGARAEVVAPYTG
jgi:tRNA-modifying protein YgfZ